MSLGDDPAIVRLGALPWGSRRLRRLGEAICAGEAPPADCPRYADVMLWYDDLAAAVQSVLRALDWTSLLHDRPPPELTSRAKTVDTLREKLVRKPDHPLGSIQDVAGVRFECEMTLEEQDVVVQAITEGFDHPPTVVHDLRTHPVHGYRAVHVWLRLPQGRVEIQVRTHIQSAWANAYEAAADVLGRGIRYGEPARHDAPWVEGLVHGLQQISLRRGADLERLRQEHATRVLDLGMDDPYRAAVVSAADRADLVARQARIAADEEEFLDALHDVEDLMRKAHP
ncbi:hypothetical protein [Cellulomonas triticagri]|uniref:RelA/SpoT domain-containing protein n=1 Tax=Cellulomonas triticagri TaxID=2483352 RepID=A0A3M2IYQ3_9CELL|nr:hypothetical protein [Cellulomonas triticagri]RMI07002.1 hypothetical protein EBM89_14180 [Cellulomonas triticagri]